jgi:UDP-N-acetylglucosamine 2-epimerase (non-hydrolysing)
MMGARESALGPVLCVVGARPNYMKMAPLLRAFAADSVLPRAVLVHTGQHYDHALNDRLFEDLELPAPDLNLEVGSGTHAVQTAEVMKRFEPVVDQLQPSAVLVVGDVNSTLACSLVAAKKGIAVIHVEAGLRSYDRAMPEEINRVLTDQLADLMYTTERSAHANLVREGVASERVVFVGNLMIDSLRAALPKAVAAETTVVRENGNAELLRDPRGFGVVTLHRPSNVDDPATLREVLSILADVAARVPLIWPMHPRTRASIERAGLADMLVGARIISLPPQGYLEMVGLMGRAALTLTDSGGVQEETTALGVPCLTLRTNTERPITIEQGTNTLVGRDRAKVLACVDEILAGGGKRGRVPEYWDGHTAERIVQHLARWLSAHCQAAHGLVAT